ncbi:MAG: hypothetical protein J6V98_01955, partial [Bacteroidales bacterium]|nr:hypothetical protein [Bacteroidales bacterium]
LSICCHILNGTKMGQQWDNKRTSVGVTSESSVPYTALITNPLRTKSHLSRLVVSAIAYGTGEVFIVVFGFAPNHRPPTTDYQPLKNTSCTT